MKRKKNGNTYKIDNLDRKEVVRMYVECKMSMKDIAKQLKGLPAYVREILLSEGVKIRSKSDVSKINRERRRQDTAMKSDVAHMYYNEKISLQKIARKHKVSVSTLDDLMFYWGMGRREAVSPTQKKIDKLPAKQIVSMYVDRKMSSYDIAEKFGTSAVTIRKVLKQNGIERRSISESKQVWWDKQVRPTDSSFRNKGQEIDTSLPEGLSFDEQVKTLRSRKMFAQDMMSVLDCTPQEMYDVLTRLGL